MADLINIAAGDKPWQPRRTYAHQSTLWHEYDGPLVGIVVQDGVDYLFYCVAGGQENVNLWMYTYITEAEREAIEASQSNDEFDHRVHSHAASHDSVMAVAISDYGIVSCVEYTPGPGAFDEAVEEVFDVFEQWLHSLRAGTKIRKAALTSA